MKGIVVLIGESNSGPLIVNHLKNYLPIIAVIKEKKESRKIFLKRRLRKNGLWKLIGQMTFMLVVPRFLKRSGEPRILRIKEKYSLNFEIPTDLKVYHVDSVNSVKVRDCIQNLEPDLVLVVGTRIIKQNILNAIEAPFINIHAGITPQFRGVHGGYWALVTKKPFGTTVHFIDQGIDTGKVIYQKIITPSKEDNFITYPYLQMAEILDDLVNLINELFNNSNRQHQVNVDDSKLWSHPTIWQYISNYIKLGVK
jgi:methionyl-tRNA formyltransferase